jgi:glycerophosphoryl diester phosphodiesterase
VTARTLRLAHRGDSRVAPENTLAAFRAALDHTGCDGLELDVRLSADGVPVVCHDPTLERVLGLPDRVDAASAAWLGRHDVPTLADVLEFVGRRPFLDIELKVNGGLPLVEVLAAGRGPELHNAVVSSFEPTALESVAHKAPAWPRWLNTVALDDGAVTAAQALGCGGISAEWHTLDAATVSLATEAGLDVVAWTVRRRATFDRLAGLGVAAICVEAAALDG